MGKFSKVCLRMAVTLSVLVSISCKIMDVIALVDVRGLCQNILEDYMCIFINFAPFTAVENGYGNSFMYNLGLQLFSAFLQMSLQQRFNLLRLD